MSWLIIGLSIAVYFLVSGDSGNNDRAKQSSSVKTLTTDQSLRIVDPSPVGEGEPLNITCSVASVGGREAFTHQTETLKKIVWVIEMYRDTTEKNNTLAR